MLRCQPVSIVSPRVPALYMTLVGFLISQNFAAAGTPESFVEPEPVRPVPRQFEEQLRTNIKPIRDFVGHTDQITGIRFRRNGAQAVTSSNDGTLRIWQVDNGQELGRVKGLEGSLASLSVNGDELAVTGGSTKIIYVCDLDAGTVKQSLRGLANSIEEVMISPDGHYCAAVDVQGNGYAWEISTGKGAPLKHRSATGPLKHVRFRPGAHTLWASGEFEGLCRWSVDDWRAAGETTLQTPAPNRRFVFSPDGKYLLAATRNTFATAIWDAENGDFEPAGRPLRVSSLSGIEFVGGLGYDYFVLCAGNGAVEFWRAADEQFSGQFPGAVDAHITAVGYCGPAKYTLTGHADGSLSLWQLDCLRQRPEDLQDGDSQQARQWLDAKNFDKLSEMVDGFRKSRESYGSGLSKSYWFYLSLSSPSKENDWATQQATIDEWHKSKPDAVAPLVLKAETLMYEGWAARGNGWASTVTPEGWKVFGEKLKQAQQAIDEAEQLDQKDPELYRIQMIIFKAFSYPRADRRRLQKGARYRSVVLPAV